MTAHRCLGFRSEVTGEASDDPEACDMEAECNARCPAGTCAMMNGEMEPLVTLDISLRARLDGKGK